MTATEHETSGHADRIAVIAEAIRAAYGEDAVVVVERQIEAAETGETRADWLAIFQRLHRPADRH